MTGNSSWFLSFTKVENGGKVFFGNNSKKQIISIGKVSKDSSTFIKNVCLVKQLKQNLFIISQLCDRGYRVIFYIKKCVIENACNDKVFFVGKRCVNVGTIDIKGASSHNKCLSALRDHNWLWHRRLYHASMYLILRISKSDLVKRLPKFGFKKDRVCEACQFRK